MFKRILIVALVVAGGCLASASSADAGIFYRRAPVRYVAVRAVLPPYPVARAVVPGPMYRPWIGYGPAYYAAPMVYGPSVGVVVY